VNSAEAPIAVLFARAAALLMGEFTVSFAEPDARLLLEALGYAEAVVPAGGGEADSRNRNRACLLKAASRFKRIFELAAPDAPGLVSWRAVAAWLVGVAVAVPFVDSTLWQSPLAVNVLHNTDISGYVGAVVGGVAYWRLGRR